MEKLGSSLLDQVQKSRPFYTTNDFVLVYKRRIVNVLIGINLIGFAPSPFQLMNLLKRDCFKAHNHLNARLPSKKLFTPYPPSQNTHTHTMSETYAT